MKGNTMLKTQTFGKIVAMAVIGVAVMTGSALADLLAYEGFDYEPNATQGALDGQSGGVGFNAAWATSHYYISANSLDNSAFPDDMLSGNKVTGANGATRTATRSLISQDEYNLNPGTDGAFYFSFLMTKWSIASNTQETAQLSLTGGSSFITIGIGSNERGLLNIGSGENFTDQVVIAAAGQVVWVVGKVETTNDGQDQVSVNFYGVGDTGPGEVEPVVWDIIATNSLSGAITGIQLTNFSNTAAQFDEVRLGTTWGSITTIPEPASAVGLSLGCLLLLRSRR